jgi:hypothetical protein
MRPTSEPWHTTTAGQRRGELLGAMQRDVAKCDRLIFLGQQLSFAECKLF